MNKILIVPTDNIQNLCNSKDDLKFFFSKFPFEVLIEIALATEDNRDFSVAIWEEVDRKLTFDEVERLDLNNIETALEIITELFYEELRSISIDFDVTYMVLHWLPDSVCLIPDDFNLSKIEPHEIHYTASQF